MGVRERVLVRVTPANKGVASRVRAELDIIGLDAEALELPADAPVLGPNLLAKLDSTDAGAAIEIDMGVDHIDVWVADGTTGKTLTRRFDLALDPEQSKPRTLAIAAVELLRASRLEYALSDTQPPSPEPSKQEDETERPPVGLDLERIGSLSLAAMFGASPGGLGPTFHIEVAGRWAILPSFALRFALRVPVLGNSVSNEFGDARVFISTLVVEPQWTPTLRRALWFRPALGLGLGGAVTGVAGQPVDGMSEEGGITPRAPVLGGFVADGHLDLGFALHPRVWLHLDGHLGILQPAPRVFIFSDEPVANFGLPWAVGALAIELWI